MNNYKRPSIDCSNPSQLLRHLAMVRYVLLQIIKIMSQLVFFANLTLITNVKSTNNSKNSDKKSEPSK